MIRIALDDKRPRRYCPGCDYDLGFRRTSVQQCPECGRSIDPDRLLAVPRAHLRMANWRRIVVGLLPVALVAVSIVPGAGEFLEPITFLGRSLALSGATIAPVLIYAERAYDLRQRLISNWRRIAIGETVITIVIDAAIIVCLWMLVVAALALLYLV